MHWVKKFSGVTVHFCHQFRESHLVLLGRMWAHQLCSCPAKWDQQLSHCNSVCSSEYPHPPRVTHGFLGCGSTQRQREAKWLYSWIYSWVYSWVYCWVYCWVYSWVSGRTRDAALLAQPRNCPWNPGVCQEINMPKTTTYPGVCSNQGLLWGSLISFMLCMKLPGGGKAVNGMLVDC